MHSRATTLSFLCINTWTPTWEVSHVTFVTLSFGSYVKMNPSRLLSRVQGRSVGLVMEEQAGSAGNSPQHGRGSARQDVLRCGWLRKQGGFVKTWHTRWFVLRGDQLQYYKDEDETKALVRNFFLFSSQLTGHVFTYNTRRCAHFIVYTLHSSFTRKYHDILQVQISCQDPNKRGEERLTCFLPHINLCRMITCHGSSSNNGDFYPQGHAAGFE